jgi:hypothetical protein
MGSFSVLEDERMTLAHLNGADPHIEVSKYFRQTGNPRLIGFSRRWAAYAGQASNVNR